MYRVQTAQTISIHALREEGDPARPDLQIQDNNFYPRPPRGGRPTSGWPTVWPLAFLSTPSARRATQGGQPDRQAHAISIHALREEGDARRRLRRPDAHNFYPRPPRGGRRDGLHHHLHRANFYPRPPRGGRPKLVEPLDYPEKFLSTPSARRATPRRRRRWHSEQISIHALREEGDVDRADVPEGVVISIHALREEGDPTSSASAATTLYFYPRPPRGGRQQKQRQNLYFQTNYTTFCTNLEEL